MDTDEMELDTIGDIKTALFVIISDTDDTFNFIVAMLYTQLFNLLCDRADDVYGGRLPVHVRCLLDEFANIGSIPKFEKLIATIRSRECSASIILQSQSQLKSIYKDAADIISDNCDCTLFLSGRGKNAKEISEALGKETIDSYNTSENRGREVSHGLNYQKLGKELMTQDEIAVMDGGKCILQVRGVRPVISDKYDITRHPNYKYLSDADRKTPLIRNAICFHPQNKAAGNRKPMSVDYYEIVHSTRTPPNKGRRFFLPTLKHLFYGGIKWIFHSAVDVLQTLVIALGAGLCIWGVSNSIRYGQDNPGAKSQGMKQLMAGGGVA
jgi:type IV secretory pathway TraG/TraD family ATPase VirD4